jgi:hypothetical protein
VRIAGRLLVVGWLAAALVVLGLDGRLPAFLAWAVPGTLLALGLGRLVLSAYTFTCRLAYGLTCRSSCG